MKEPAQRILEVGKCPINLTQALKLAGCAPSGGAAKALIAGGGVQLNGQVELRKRCKLKAGDVIVTRDGAKIVVQSQASASVELRIPGDDAR
jgi:ribosome-associated protein